MLKIRTQFIPKGNKNPGLTTSPDNHSTVNSSSDSFCAEKRKPGSLNPGYDVAEEATSDDLVPFTLPSSVFTDNANNLLASEAMVSYNAGYIKLPRSLLTCERYISLHAIHKFVFQKIVELACWKSVTFDDNGTLFILQPGDVCISIRELVKQCGKGVTKNWVVGTLSSAGARQFLRHEVRHQKTIITITHKDTYDLICNRCQTASHTEVRQRSDIKEEDKKIIKKENIKRKKAPKTSPVVSATASRLFFIFLEALKKEHPKVKETSKWIFDFAKILDIDRVSPEDVEKAIGRIPGHWYTENVRCAKKFRDEFHRYSKDKSQVTNEEILEMTKRLGRKYDYEFKDGFLSTISPQGSRVKFHKSETEKFDKWLKERNL